MEKPGPSGPATGPERVQALDVVRGVALLGILLVNVHLFRGLHPAGLLSGEAPAGRGVADRVVEILTGTFATGTFLGLFSLLFGVGIALQLSRPRRGALSPRLLGPIGYVPPAEYEEAYYGALQASEEPAPLTETSLRQSRGDSSCVYPILWVRNPHKPLRTSSPCLLVASGLPTSKKPISGR